MYNPSVSVFSALFILPVTTNVHNWEQRPIIEYSVAETSPVATLSPIEWGSVEELLPDPLPEQLEWKLPAIDSQQVLFSAEKKITERITQLKRHRVESQRDQNKDNLKDLSHDSELDLLSFLKEAEAQVAPMLTMKSNGNFRAIWKDAMGQQIAIQFLGQSKLQYVCMVLIGDGSGGRNIHYGNDTFSTFLRFVNAYGLDGLLRK